MKYRIPAILFGPFIGELNWELYRFAPHAIYLKNRYPWQKTIVLTRKERFDLYGKYADILIPLNISENAGVQNGFGIENFDTISYDEIAKVFNLKYKSKFDIKEHLFPDIGWRSRIKWQFHRDQMNYDFKPRKHNEEIIKANFEDFKNVVLSDEYFSSDYNVITIEEIRNRTKTSVDGISSTYIGCLIEFIKKCLFVVCEYKSVLFRLCILLNIPVITKNKIDQDELYLLNPNNTKVIYCEDIEEGIEIYENNL